MRRLAALLALVSLAVGQGGEPGADGGGEPAAPGKQPEAAAAPGPVTPATEAKHKVTLKSGTILVGEIAPVEWQIKTEFGMLRVPVRDIGKVVFGRLADPERIERTRAWIEDLASGDSRRRAMAKMALLRDGRFAVPDIERAAEKHSDPEVKRLCKEIVDELNIPEDRRLNDKDLVETKAFSFRGAIQPQSFQVRVIELGGLNIRRRDIATITVYRPEMVQRIKFDGQHTLREWLDTEIKLKKGERFEILASGTIRFPAWGTTGVFSPEGNPNSNMNNFKLGTLLGRIDNGTWFKIGQDYRGRANATGTLHICLNINVNRGNQQSTGNFEIEIRRDGG